MVQKKNAILAAVAFVGIGILLGVYYCTCIPSESVACYHSIQIGARYGGVKMQLEQCGFRFTNSRSNAKTCRYSYFHEQDQVDVLIEVKNDCVSDKKIEMPATFISRSWRKVVDWICGNEPAIYTIPLEERLGELPADITINEN